MVYVFAPYRLLPLQRQLLNADVPVKLGSRAFDVLVALVERRDRTVSKNELLDIVWLKLVVEENNLEVQIVTLRKLLGYAAIATVPGRGYRFTLPVTQEGGSVTRAQPGDSAVTPANAKLRADLPSSFPTLIGRDEDVRRLLSLVERHALVTVVGAAGIGKTRLAQAAASKSVERTSDAVWWVDLAPLSDGALVPSAVAIALGLRLEGSGDATSVLLTALREETALLVLDNAEHVIEAVADFAEKLSQSAPGIRVLVTSQQPLHIEGEQIYRPKPLSLPEADDPESISGSAAVALFVARAMQADGRFEISPVNQAAVADICRRLDGIPLAIELAAARVGLLGVERLRQLLDQRFHVLTVGRRTSLRRHQTMRGALEWSYQLLSSSEQVVFRRLSVFVGGFTLEAAQHLAEDEGTDCWDVLEHLGALIDKSLVVAEGEAAPRYRMLETTRLFALEKLIDSGKTHVVRARHREHFVELAEECHRRLLTGDARRDFATLDLERDNLLLALAWAPAADDASLGLRLAAALHHYWFLRAMPALGAQVTRAALERPGAESSTLERCRALVTAGWLSSWAGQDVAALRHMEEAMRLARHLADPATLCLVLVKFAHVRHHRNESEDALRLTSEALDVGRTLLESVELGDALVMRAQVHVRSGNRASARALFEEALALRTRLNHPSGIMSIHMGIARMDIDDNALDEAKRHLNEALALRPVADLQAAALHLIAVGAQWAAVAGRYESSVFLEAACERQLSRAGLRNLLEPSEIDRLERARLALDAATRQELEDAGRAVGYEQALQATAEVLRGERGMVALRYLSK